jgi:hypothetical protein
MNLVSCFFSRSTARAPRRAQGDGIANTGAMSYVY